MSEIHPPINLLAIETATNACSVALSVNHKTIERFVIEPRAHTRILLPMIDEVLKEASIHISQIEVLAYGCGPGSFTGVRIAAAVIQGLGFAHSKPIIPVSSLRALAQQVMQKTHKTQICAMFDARMQEMYWGLFKANEAGLMEAVSQEQLSSKQNICVPEGDWLFEEGYPMAREVLTIAKTEYALGRSIKAKDALPVYLRNRIV